jgi:hypothetical protein
MSPPNSKLVWLYEANLFRDCYKASALLFRMIRNAVLKAIWLVFAHLDETGSVQCAVYVKLDFFDHEFLELAGRPQVELLPLDPSSPSKDARLGIAANVVIKVAEL